MTTLKEHFLGAALVLLILCMAMASPLHAAQSTITEAEGQACMGEDKSRKQTENEAYANTKRKAAENASTYIKSETKVKNMELENDLINAYANATIKIIQILDKGWFKDPTVGECYKLKIKAEVIPDEKSMVNLAKEESLGDDPSAPLKVRLWTDKKEYGQSEKIKIFIKGNKPFYARILYRDSRGTLLQLLPNPYRSDNYFQGAVIYEIPSGSDQFDLEVNPPFGEENIIVYASSSPLGELGLKHEGPFYKVTTRAKDVGQKTRGIKILQKSDANEKPASEFYEETLAVKTMKK
jgi:hypothetical protein